ncbi:chromatin assembly factor-1 (FASCIATA1) (FAS1) [Wolffia australiana]
METVQQEMSVPEKGTMKPLKRKRVSVGTDIDQEEKKTLIEGFHDEISKLYGYFQNFLAWKVGNEESEFKYVNSAIACMLEGSRLPYSKLACEIFEKLKEKNGVTLASVQRDINFIGSRLNYGVNNGSPNLLEDLSDSCLWCWEVRDMKLLPTHRRKMCAAQRKGREKIRQRIVALSDILAVLKMPENEENYKTYLQQASDKLSKTLNEEQISSILEKMTQKSSNETNSDGKEMLKEIEKNMRLAEKEKRKQDRQLEKEKLESEREAKRQQIEAEKEEKRREKEEAEQKKRLKRAQEEAEREQKWREKEETEAKKQLSVKKQATIMERFLKSKKPTIAENNVKDLNDATCSSVSDSSLQTTISIMDSKLTQEANTSIEDLRRFHMATWHGLRRREGVQRWGVRRYPKAKIFNDLKLQVSSCDNAKSDVVDEDLGENQPIDPTDELVVSRNPGFRWVKKLLQFDKSYRPPYYGSWSKKSDTIKPRCPLAKDPNLDYDVDSDEEWEEEEPGESLSDCDKDEEDLASEGPKEDEDESDDGFFVPDGYLSENEGVQNDCSGEVQVASGSDSPDIENEEFGAIIQQQRFLDRLTQQALRKNQPLILMFIGRTEADGPLTKTEEICRQALHLVPFAGAIDQPIEPQDCSPAEPDLPENAKEETVTPPSVKGKRVRSKGKGQAPPSGGSVSLPELLAAAAARKVAVSGDMPPCLLNMQAPLT